MMKPKVNSKDQSSNQKKSNNIKKEPQDNIKNKFKREGNPKKKLLRNSHPIQKGHSKLKARIIKPLTPAKK